MRQCALAILIAMPFVGCDGSTGCQQTFSGHTDYVRSVAFNPNGEQIVSGGEDGTIRFWEIGSGQCQRTLGGDKGFVHSVALSSDGRFLASGGRDNLVNLWDVESGKKLKTFIGHSGFIASVAFSPDDRHLASCGGDKLIKIWDVASANCLKTLGSEDSITASMVLFGPDGKQLFFAGDTLQLWDTETGECLRSFEGHSDSVGTIAISRGGKWVASAGEYTDSTIRLWDVKSGKCLWQRDFTEQGGGAWSLVFTSEHVLVSGHSGGAIRYWDVESGKCHRTVRAHSKGVLILAADSKGQYVASGGWDNLIKLWKVPSSEPIDK